VVVASVVATCAPGVSRLLANSSDILTQEAKKRGDTHPVAPASSEEQSTLEQPAKHQAFSCEKWQQEHQQVAPSDPHNFLYYVNRWHEIPSTYPFDATTVWTPCQEHRSSAEPGWVCLPSTYSYKEKSSLRQAAFESPVPDGIPSTYDGMPVGFKGKVGFKAMFDAALEEVHVRLLIRSGFRSYTSQYATFLGWVAYERRRGLTREQAQRKVSTYSAQPGHSEHQLGTTADLVYIEPDGKLYDGWDRETIANSKAMRWVQANAHRFGIVLSYPQGQESSTAYDWEPWHYRYIGVESANVVRQCQWNTEQLLSQLYQTTPKRNAHGVVSSRQRSKP
jgi:hypothetical protein